MKNKQKPNFTIEIITEIFGILIMMFGAISIMIDDRTFGFLLMLSGALIYFIVRSMEEEIR